MLLSELFYKIILRFYVDRIALLGILFVFGEIERNGTFLFDSKES